MNVRWSNRATNEFAATAMYVASVFGQKAAPSFCDEETGIEFRELHCRLNSVVCHLIMMKFTS